MGDIEIEVTGYQPTTERPRAWRARLSDVPIEPRDRPTVDRSCRRLRDVDSLPGLLTVLGMSPGFWKVLLALAAIALLAALLMPSPHHHRDDAKKTADGDALKGLMKALVASVAEGNAVPESTGWQFWAALFVGDGAADVPVLTAGDMGFLVCPRDPIGDESEAIGVCEAVLLDGPRRPELLVYEDGSPICCYTGPRRGVFRNGFDPSDLTGRIVGTTAGRRGITFFDDGMNVVWGNIKAEYIVFDKVAADPEWGAAETWTDIKGGGSLRDFFRDNDSALFADIDREHIPD